MTPIPEEEQGFLRAAQEFIKDYAVEFIAVEVIVSIPDAGLAGTVDWIGRIGDMVVLGDWKTRGKRHGAYPEEVAQVGTYSLADFMVVGKFPGERTPMPKLTDLMIVSLLDDGSYAAYPIALDQARDTARHMIDAQWSVDNLAAMGTRAIGSPLKGQAPVPEDDGLRRRQLWLRRRVQALPPEAKTVAARTWTADVPKNADVLSHEQIDFVAAVLDRAEAEHDVPFGELDPAAEPTKPRRQPPAGSNKRKQTAI